MDCDFTTDRTLLTIKEKLNEDKIKLWLTPFFEKEGSNKEELMKLASDYSEKLCIPFDECLEHLFKLQSKALFNLEEKLKYENTGVATLKVRIPNRNKPEIITVNIELSKTGLFLKEVISKEISVPIESLKIIFQGKILKDEETLESQKIKNRLHIMAVILKDDSNSFLRQEGLTQLLDSTKADIKLLAKDNKKHYFQVADQSGKLLKLSKKEKESLILAMALHEKGRVAIKKEDFALALIFLLEAEKEFSLCNASLLNKVDNYGLLNLDIVWCYLNLQSITQLSNAEERLLKCELTFNQSYGQNLERLVAVKGSACNENALFLRLHLLQAIVFYHLNQIEKAKALLIKAEEEFKVLHVDETLLSRLTELGYGKTEARLALRQSQNDLNVAVSIIENKKEEKKKHREDELKEKKLNKERKKLGKCKNGDWIEPQLHKALMEMGYSYHVARWALAQSNNNISSGINLIQEQSECLPVYSIEISDNLVEEVTSLGFNKAQAIHVLRKHEGNINKAIDDLLGDSVKHLDFYNSNSDTDDSDSGKKEAYNRLSQGLSRCEEDYLDLNLIAEAAFLQKYKELML